MTFSWLNIIFKKYNHIGDFKIWLDNITYLFPITGNYQVLY